MLLPRGRPSGPGLGSVVTPPTTLDRPPLRADAWLAVRAKADDRFPSIHPTAGNNCVRPADLSLNPTGFAEATDHAEHRAPWNRDRGMERDTNQKEPGDARMSDPDSSVYNNPTLPVPCYASADCYDGDDDWVHLAACMGSSATPILALPPGSPLGGHAAAIVARSRDPTPLPPLFGAGVDPDDPTLTERKETEPSSSPSPSFSSYTSTLVDEGSDTDTDMGMEEDEEESASSSPGAPPPSPSTTHNPTCVAPRGRRHRRGRGGPFRRRNSLSFSNDDFPIASGLECQWGLFGISKDDGVASPYLGFSCDAATQTTYRRALQELHDHGWIFCASRGTRSCPGGPYHRRYHGYGRGWGYDRCHVEPYHDSVVATDATPSSPEKKTCQVRDQVRTVLNAGRLQVREGATVSSRGVGGERSARGIPERYRTCF